MNFKNDKQKTTQLVYEELTKCIDTLLAPTVFRNILNAYIAEGYVTIAELTIDSESLTCKAFFGKTKSLPLEDYSHTNLSQGTVSVYGRNDKLFYSCNLNDYNAPLMSSVIGVISGQLGFDE